MMTLDYKIHKDAAKSFMPKSLYHYSNTDTSGIVNLLKNIKEIEVRIRKMK